MSCADGQNGTVSVSPCTNADKEPIDVRAWTMQEALLSPRRLIYGSRQIWWVCPTKVEWDGPEQVIGADHPDQACLPYEILDDNIGRNSGRYNLTAERVAQRRGELVEQSTARDLTFAEDRLLVMSGIADRFSRLLSTQYLAGLWRNSLINDMLWHCNDRASSAAETTRFPPSHTPSWSWGATRGKISWCSAPTLPLTTESESSAEVLEAYVEPQMAAAPFGDVKSGSIELAGVLYDAFIDKHDALRAFDLTLDGCIQSSTHSYLDDTLKNVTACGKIRKIACLPLRVEECVYHAICRALVLEPVARKQGTWLRVGAVTVS